MLLDDDMQEQERAPRRDGAHSPFSVAPEQDLLYSLTADGRRRWIDPVLSHGRFLRIRRPLAYGLIALFVVLPLLPVAGKPAMFLDLLHRQFTFFGITFHPTDSLMLLALGAMLILGLFVVTALFGRLWCGFACPQPVYLEFVYRPIERWLEGKPSVRRRRDAGPWTADRAGRKTAKWALYLLLSLIFSASFVAYFVGWEQGLLGGLLQTPGKHQGTLFALLATTGLMFYDFAYFRDQMCTVACPYGRLQNVLYDRDTVIVGYDARRGEPRQARRKGLDESSLGDCIDCKACIRTCPTGMDIRRGLQMECIGCAQCIEACDLVMARVQKPSGLIRYTSLRELETGEKRFWRPRVFVYGGIMVAALVALLVLALNRGQADVEILRGGREPFRMLPTGEVANILRLRLTNQLDVVQQFTVELVAPAGAQLVVSRSPFPVAPNHVDTLDVVARLPEAAFTRGRVEGRFRVRSDAGVEITRDFLLLGPHR